MIQGGLIEATLPSTTNDYKNKYLPHCSQHFFIFICIPYPISNIPSSIFHLLRGAAPVAYGLLTHTRINIFVAPGGFVTVAVTSS